MVVGRIRPQRRAAGIEVQRREPSSKSSAAPASGAAKITASQPDPAGPPFMGGGLARLVEVENGAVFVVKIFQLHPLDFLSNEPLNGLHMAGVLRHHEGKGVSRGFGPPGPAN